MVTTIDGKIVTGNRDEPVQDLGSKTDHAAMRNIQNAVEAVVVGAGSMRATPKMWYPARLKRYVVTRSGELPWESRFFSDAPEQAFVACPGNASVRAPEGVVVLPFGSSDFDPRAFVHYIRQVHGVENLLIEGGSEVNAQFLAAGLVDELFLTIAPKVKLGRQTPTYAGGDAFDRDEIPSFELVEHAVIGDETFLRYRRLSAE